MTRDTLMQMAYESTVVSHLDAFYPMTVEALEHFANLVAEKEREACAQLCDDRKLECTEVDAHFWNESVECCAQAIRARGQK